MASARPFFPFQRLHRPDLQISLHSDSFPACAPCPILAALVGSADGKMNDSRTVFKTLSELYPFNKKLVKAYSIPQPKPSRVTESPAVSRPPKPSQNPRCSKSIS